MRKLISEFKFTVATVSLIIMNLIPLAGVFWFGWDVGTIVFLYWLENVVIGLLNISKIMACQRTLPFLPDRHATPSDKRLATTGIIFLPVFFTLHYGGFCAGHYAFLKATFKDLPSFGEMLPTLLSPVLFWSLLGLTFSHIISMGVNFFGKGEYVGRPPNKQMSAPYPRIVLLHFVIIASGFFAQKMGEGLAVLFLLIGLKIVFDLAAHLVEHARAKNQTLPSPE